MNNFIGLAHTDMLLQCQALIRSSAGLVQKPWRLQPSIHSPWVAGSLGCTCTRTRVCDGEKEPGEQEQMSQYKRQEDRKKKITPASRYSVDARVWQGHHHFRQLWGNFLNRGFDPMLKCVTCVCSLLAKCLPLGLAKITPANKLG